MIFRNYVYLAATLLLLSGCGKSEPTTDGGLLGIPSGIYAVDKSHTSVTFSYFHQGLSYPLLRATGVDGELDLDSDALQNSRASIAMDVESIRSNLDYFDKELASRKFFHADKYPHITFAKHSYTPSNESTGELTGFVTIREITKPVVLSIQINGAIQHPALNTPVIGFSASGSLKRSDFGLDRFIPMVGDQVEIRVEAEFLHGSNEGSAAAVKLATDAIANADPASLQVSADFGAER